MTPKAFSGESLENLWGLRGIAVCLRQMPDSLQSAKAHVLLSMAVRTSQGKPK